MKPTDNHSEEQERERGSFLFVRRRHSRSLPGEEKPGLSTELLLMLAFVVILAAFGVLLFVHLFRHS